MSILSAIWKKKKFKPGISERNEDQKETKTEKRKKMRNIEKIFDKEEGKPVFYLDGGTPRWKGPLLHGKVSTLKPLIGAAEKSGPKVKIMWTFFVPL